MNELARRRNKTGRKGSGEEAKMKLSAGTPEEELKMERERDRRQSAVAMLEKNKKKNEMMSGKLKNFMDKIAPPQEQDEDEKEEVVEEKPKETEIIKTKIPTLTFEESYKEARKSRYVRTTKLRDFEIELSTDDVFKR